MHTLPAPHVFTQQKQWQFPNVFRFVHFMCTNQCTKLDKLLVCKLRKCLFATTAVSMCANYLHTLHLQCFLPRNPIDGAVSEKLSSHSPRVQISVQSSQPQ